MSYIIVYWVSFHFPSFPFCTNYSCKWMNSTHATNTIFPKKSFIFIISGFRQTGKIYHTRTQISLIPQFLDGVYSKWYIENRFIGFYLRINDIWSKLDKQMYSVEHFTIFTDLICTGYCILHKSNVISFGTSFKKPSIL